MIKWGIRTRLIVSFLFLIVFTMSLFGSYILWYFYRHNLTNLTASLGTQAQIVQQLLTDSLRSPREKSGIDSHIKELAVVNDLRITVIDPNGVVLGDSWENPAIMENHLLRPEVAAAFNGEKGTAIRYSTTINENMLYVAIPVLQSGEILGVVRVASTLAHVEAAFSQIRSVLLTAIFLTSLLAVVVSIRLARKYTAPLEEITDTARQIADGRLDQRVHIRTGDELEMLAHTLNNLASNLDDKINEAVAETRKLSLILRHMDNAVILLDKYGKVTTVNKMAKDIFGITDAMIGQHNIQVIGNSLLDWAVHETITKGESRIVGLKTNIKGARRVFQVFVAPIMSNENDISGVLSVFHDITALQEMHERQAEFVANASHELATPLTSIRGFAETLLDGALQDPELSTKFIQIIFNEADRMQRLIKDLLQLAKLNSDEYRQQVKMEPVAIQSLLKVVAEELSPNANRKNIAVTIQPAYEQFTVTGNQDWLRQALINLLDNSIKYTPAGGTIVLKCWREGNNAAILIKDSGIGIPAQDLSLIFDRFYRVDRARTAGGGTGLGLPIVKFIVEMHSGQIEVKSEINRGTAIILTLPLSADGD